MVVVAGTLICGLQNFEKVSRSLVVILIQLCMSMLCV